MPNAEPSILRATALVVFGRAFGGCSSESGRRRAAAEASAYGLRRIPPEDEEEAPAERAFRADGTNNDKRKVTNCE